MRLRPDFHEAFLLNLLDARQPELLTMRRDVALDMLQHVSPERLRGLFTPAVAQVVLDVTRLGALELEAAEGVWTDDQLAGLVRVRQILSSMAAHVGSTDFTSCLVPDGRRWLPMHLARTENPWPRLGAMSVLIDHARQRVDRLGDELHELVAIHGGGPENLYVARTRFGLDVESFRGPWSLAATTAVRVARRASGSSLPRWTGIGMNGPMADLSTLPHDVRLVLVDSRAGLPQHLRGWTVSLYGVNEDVVDAWSRGRSVCLMVDSPAMAAESVLAFRRFDDGVCAVPAPAVPRQASRYIRFPAVGAAHT